MGLCIVRIETTVMVCFVLINIINLNIRISVYWVRKWHNIKQRPLRFVRITPTCTTTTSKIPFSQWDPLVVDSRDTPVMDTVRRHR